MRRAPAVTALVVGTLSVGIGANLSLVGAIKHLLLRAPDHVIEPERVVRLLRVSRDSRGYGLGIGASYPTLLDLQREATAFEAVAGFTSRQFSLGIGANAVVVHATLVSAEFFRLLGAKPSLGRTFSSVDGYASGTSSGGSPLAVLSYGSWQRHFGGDRAVLGKRVQIGEIHYTIVGVMPSGFRGAEDDPPDVWLPINVTANDSKAYLTLWSRSRIAVSLLARLRPGVAHSMAEHQASTIWREGQRAMPDADTAVSIEAASLIRARGPDAPREVKVALWLAGVSGLVLLISCATVGNLLLARAFSRRQEIAVRLALGAGRGRLARQTLTEGMLLALAGGAVAVWLAGVGGPALNRVLMGEAAPEFIDAGVLVFAATLALGTGVLVSFAPVLQNVGKQHHADLRVGGTSSGGSFMSRARMWLVGVQSALCMAMLVLAGLFALSLKRSTGLDLGLDVAHTVRAQVNLDHLVLADDAIQATYDEMLRNVLLISEVVDAAIASSDPYHGGRAVAVYTPTRDADEIWRATNDEVVMESSVGARFFRTVGAKSLRGRDFEDTDHKGAPLVAIVNSPLAKILYPGEEALGSCIILPVRSNDRGGPCVTIVGVLSGVWYGSIANREKPMVYVPLAQKTGYDGVFRPRGVFVRTRTDPDVVIEEIRRVLQSVRSDLPAVRVTAMRDVVAAETRPWRLGALMFGLFGAVALVVAVVGLYGVVAFTVVQRSFEIKVRLSLGARRRDIVHAVAGGGLSAVAAGLAIGAGIAFAARGRVGPLLFQTAPDDPLVIVGVGGLLFATGLMAIVFPTTRALRLDSASVLHHD